MLKMGMIVYLKIPSYLCQYPVIGYIRDFIELHVKDDPSKLRESWGCRWDTIACMIGVLSQ